jgi:hypothetical protein
MNSRLLDPWFLLEIYETIFRVIIGIVFLGIAVEFIGLLYLSFREGTPRQKRKGV